MRRGRGKAVARSALVTGAVVGSMVLAGCSTSAPSASNSAAPSGSNSAAPATTVTYAQGVPLEAGSGAQCKKSNKAVSALRIAYIPPASVYNYYLAIGAGMEARAKEVGASYTMLAPAKDDVSMQLGMIQDAATSGVDAIVLHTHDEAASAPALARVAAQGIDIILVNSDIPKFPTPVNAVVGYKERAGDKLVGQYAVKAANGQAGTIGILEGAPGYDSTERVGGFLEGIAGASNLKVVASLNGGWDVDHGNKAATDMLQANPDITMIFAANDYMATGAVQAAKAVGRDVIIYGSDGDPNAGLEPIAAGGIKATLDTSPFGMGQVAMQVAIDCLTGALTGGDYIETPVTVVDQTTVNAILCKPDQLFPKPAKAYPCSS